VPENNNRQTDSKLALLVQSLPLSSGCTDSAYERLAVVSPVPLGVPELFLLVSSQKQVYLLGAYLRV
jgi:hypothetical protein